jgi:hypothetical protein
MEADMAGYRARSSHVGRWALAAAITVAGCSGSGDDTGATDSTSSTPVGTVAVETTIDALSQLGESLAPEQGELLCGPVFESWFGGDDPMLGTLMTTSAAASLATHPYVNGVYGLAGRGLDCFITESDPTGAVVNVAEVVFGIVDTVPTVTDVVWHEVTTMPEDVLTRFSATPPIYTPSQVSTGGGESEPTPDAPTVDALAADEVAGLQADCVYRAAVAACDRLESEGLGADTNYGLGNSLTQAPDDLLGEDCAAYLALACLELESRYPTTADDVGVIDVFVAAVLAADADTASLYATAPVVAELTLIGGPFGPSDEVEVPGTQDVGDGRFQFIVAPTVFATCYVGGGLVRYCQWSAD